MNVGLVVCLVVLIFVLLFLFFFFFVFFFQQKKCYGEEKDCSDSVPIYEWSTADHMLYLGVQNVDCASKWKTQWTESKKKKITAEKAVCYSTTPLSLILLLSYCLSQCLPIQVSLFVQNFKEIIRLKYAVKSLKWEMSLWWLMGLCLRDVEDLLKSFFV